MALAWIFVGAVVSSVAGNLIPNRIGHTKPSGDIYIESGDSLEISCHLNDNVANQGLKFTSQQDLSLYVSKEHNNTLRLFIRNPKPQNQKYSCWNGEHAIDENLVFVVEKPTDFQCTIYDYKRIQCTFKASHLPEKTMYEIKYYPTDEKYHSPKWNVITVNTTKPREYYFILDEYTVPHYKMAHDGHKIFLKVSYGPADYHLNTTVISSKHVIPGPPDDLKLSKISWEYVEIEYNLSTNMKLMLPFNYSWEHAIVWSCERAAVQWNNSVTFNTTEYHHSYNITDMPYAYALCNISVSLKASEAVDENFWSNPTTLQNVRTGSTIPGKPPEIYEEAFQVLHDHNETGLVVYWREVPEELRNGPNFTYEVKLDENTGLEQIGVMQSHALVNNFDDSLKHNVVIRAKNVDGVSDNKSVMALPKKDDRIVMFLDSFTQWDTNDVTVLSWEIPKEYKQNVTSNYKVFGCKSCDPQSQLCKEQLEEVACLKSTEGNYCEIHHNQKVNMDYALTLKTANAWTGLFWNKCNIPNNLNKTTVEKFQLKPSVLSTFYWSLECKDMAVPIKGYRVHYCKSSRSSERCVEQEQNVTIEGDRVNGSYKIENFEDDTYYLVWVSTVPLLAGQIEQTSNNCPYYSPPKPVQIVVYVAIPLALMFLIAMAFLSKTLYQKYKADGNGVPELPDGLKCYDNESLKYEETPTYCMECLRKIGGKVKGAPVKPTEKILEEVPVYRPIPVPIQSPTPTFYPDVIVPSETMLARKEDVRTSANLTPDVAETSYISKPYIQVGRETSEENADTCVIQVGQIENGPSSDVAPDAYVSKPYIQVGQEASSAPSADTFETKPYVQAGQFENGPKTKPYIQLGQVENKPEESYVSKPYIQLGQEASSAPTADTFERSCVSKPYLQAGQFENGLSSGTSETSRLSKPYVQLARNGYEPEAHPPSNNRSGYVSLGERPDAVLPSPHIPLAEFQRPPEHLPDHPPSRSSAPPYVIAGTPPKRHAPFDEARKAPEEVPLLRLPEPPRSYVVLGNRTNGTRGGDASPPRP